MKVFVKLSDKAIKELNKIPLHIAEKLYAWVDTVQHEGIQEARKTPGLHDKPLKGRRKGQRSMRLNKAYRVFYIEYESQKVHIISIIEVNKHEY